MLSRRKFVLGVLALGTSGMLAACSSNTPVIVKATIAPVVSNVSLGEAQTGLNSLRARLLLPTLSHNSALQRVADEQIALMVRNKTVSHTTESGEGFSTRIRRTGFMGGAGENLAGGAPNLESVIEGWMNSAAHRKVLSNPDYVQFGFAYRRGPSTPTNTYGTYWVLIMGVRSPAGRP